MKLFRKTAYSFGIATIAVTLALMGCSSLYGQLREPDVRAADDPLTPLEAGYHNRIGASAFVNNFGFAIGGTYARALGPYTEFTVFTGITGIRDVSEQNYQDFFTGQRIVPNKYNRALGLPFMAGIKRRLFAEHITDNFRFFVSARGGPAMAFVYPYINDEDNNGYRSSQLVETPFGNTRVFTERKNDFFSGWGEGSTHWGAAGEINVGVDLGSNFKQQSTLAIGFFFYYFDPGLQIMEPRRPILNQQGEIIGAEEFFPAQKFFGTPQIKFTYSGWW